MSVPVSCSWASLLLLTCSITRVSFPDCSHQLLLLVVQSGNETVVTMQVTSSSKPQEQLAVADILIGPVTFNLDPLKYRKYGSQKDK